MDWEKWNVLTVSHALGRLSRWTGHVKTPESYSVAQHSVLVSFLTADAPMAALFHDAAEFVLGDITTPIKMHLGEEAIKTYRALTKRWDEDFSARFGYTLNADIHKSIKVSDRLIQYYEAKHLVGVPDTELARYAKENEAFAHWGTDPEKRMLGLPSSLQSMLEPMPATQAARAFIIRYKELGGNVDA